MKTIQLDELDCKILSLVQQDADLGIEEIAVRVGSSRTPVWTRLKKLKAAGVIRRTVALLDAEQLGLRETFFVSIRTDQHSQEWLDSFADVIRCSPEIQEVHRLTGEIDYLMKVRVASSRDFDAFYKRFIGKINLFNVTSSLAMEVIKESTELLIPGQG